MIENWSTTQLDRYVRVNQSSSYMDLYHKLVFSLHDWTQHANVNSISEHCTVTNALRLPLKPGKAVGGASNIGISGI